MDERELTLKDYKDYFRTCENVLKLGIGERRRFYNLGDTAESAVLAREYGKAVEYATELLALAPKYKGDWNYGNAFHVGHTVLGRVALIKGNVTDAKQHLIKSAQVPTSPQLSTNGPRLSLARELLKLGERRVVLQFLDLVGIFWKDESKLLDSWKTNIKVGKAPQTRRWIDSL